jgi:hypothetical protein
MGSSLERITASRGANMHALTCTIETASPQLAHLSRGVMHDVRANEPDPSAGRLFDLEKGAANGGFAAPGFVT